MAVRRRLVVRYAHWLEPQWARRRAIWAAGLRQPPPLR